VNLNKRERCGATDTALYNDISFDEDFTVCAACLIERNGIDEDFVEKKEDIPRWFESYTDDPSPQIVKSGPLYTTDLKRECAFITRLAFRYHRDEVDREFGYDRIRKRVSRPTCSAKRRFEPMKGKAKGV